MVFHSTPLTANSGFQIDSQTCVFISIVSPLPLRLPSSPARLLQQLLNWSLLPVCSPQATPPISWHHQSTVQWISITCEITFIKAKVSSKTRPLPPSPFSALNPPSRDLWLQPTPPEIEGANSSSSYPPGSGIPPLCPQIWITITALSRLYYSGHLFFCISHQLRCARARTVPMFSSSL